METCRRLLRASRRLDVQMEGRRDVEVRDTNIMESHRLKHVVQCLQSSAISHCSSHAATE